MIANTITFFRIICGVVILIFPAFSNEFYIFCLLGGLSDALDGIVARKLFKTSEFGAKFDTAADIVFFLSVLIKIILSLYIPLWLIIWAGLIFLMKIIGICVSFIKYRRFPAVHSLLNKICGAALFILPLFIGRAFAWQIRFTAVIFICLLSTAAAVSELIIIKNGRIVYEKDLR